MPHTLQVALFIFLALFAPGYLIVAGWTSRTYTEEKIELPDALFLSFVLSVSITGMISLVLAQIGLFQLPLLLAILVTLSICIVLIALRKRVSLMWQVQMSPWQEWLAILVLMAVAGFLFLQPHEYIIGGGDAGVYINIGANIAQTGALLIQDPLLAAIDPATYPALLRELPPHEVVRFIQQPGFYLSNDVPGLLMPQFYPLHSVWLAIAYALFGLQGALLMTPVWGMLGVLSLYFVGRTLFDRQTGWLAAALLMVIPLQIYFARYPTAEPITQFAMWCFLWTFTLFVLQRSPNALWGLVAGLTFGQVFLARIDAIPLVLILGIWAAILLWEGEWNHAQWWFWLPAMILPAYSILHGLLFTWPYAANNYGSIYRYFLSDYILYGLAGAIVLLILFFELRQRKHWIAQFVQSKFWRQMLRSGFPWLLVLIALYAYFIRPYLGNTIYADNWYGGTTIPITNHENLVRLGWYLTPLGIGLALIGGVLILRREPWQKMWPVWSVGGLFTLFFIYNILNNPFHLYAMRRFIPAVIPFFMLGIAYTLTRMWQNYEWRVPARIFSAILLIGLLGWLGFKNQLIWAQRDYIGATEQTEQIVDLLDENAIALFVDAAPVGSGNVLGTPMQFLYGIPSYDLQEEQVDLPLLNRQIKNWQAAGHSIYVLRNSNADPLFAEEILTPIESVVWDTPYLEQSYDHMPADIFRFRYELAIYKMRELE